MRRLNSPIIVAAVLAAIGAATAAAQSGPPPVHGKRAARLVIRNATIVDGNGTPASGPADIVVEGNHISQVVFLDPVAVRSGVAKRPAAGDAEIDATGKYVLPGLIDAHAHVQEERGGIPQPLQYELDIWLACGITTVREVGADNTQSIVDLRGRSARGEVAAPRIFVYGRYSNPPVPKTPEEARQRIRDLKKMGVDGIKLLGVDRDQMTAMEDEAHKLGLRIAHHVGVEETKYWLIGRPVEYTS